MPDLDGDGIPDMGDPDIDGDGVANDKDLFPRDGKEWSDMDKDGVGDNSDPDIDGDGYLNENDAFPYDSSRHDSDGDGVPDFLDDFPDDPTEDSDLDGDGWGDNADIDKDGDGVVNSKDAYPRDHRRWNHDADFDGIPDDKDAFPLDRGEAKDTDGDGVGDEADTNPLDPNCKKAPCKMEPLNKQRKLLPEHGYDEHSEREVMHDHKTETNDWGDEFSEQDDETLKRICAESPSNPWCQKHHAPPTAKATKPKKNEKNDDSSLGFPFFPTKIM